MRRVITRFAPENMERNQPLLDLLQSLAQEKNATPAQISLAKISVYGNRTDKDIAKLRMMR